MDFNAFTRMFFYLFICYHYAKYNYPEKTDQFLIYVGYNSIYLYSKLQILLSKKLNDLHNVLIKCEEYQKIYLFLQNTKDECYKIILSKTFTSDAMCQTNKITLDFVLNNEINFSFEKDEFINDYLADFFPDENAEEVEIDEQSDETIFSLGKKALEKMLFPDEIDEIDEEIMQDLQKEKARAKAKAKAKANGVINTDSKSDEIIDYDFIVINGQTNFKKIIKHIDSIKNDFVSEYSMIFQPEPFLFKPLLCEFLNGDDDKTIKIDFCDENKDYNFLVIGNAFDKKFLTYFMKKYYEIDVKEKYLLKILDNNVNTLQFSESDIMKLDENNISKI